MSTIRFNANFNGTAIETLSATEAPAAGSREITHNQFDRPIGPLDGTTTPPAAVAAYLTLTGASGTINLTALPTLLGNVDCTGKKLRYLRINNLNVSNNFALAIGAATGYSLAGAAFVAGPLGSVQQYFHDALSAVDATHKNLDWTGTGGQSFQVTLILG
jgi:hypothetical protein